VRAARPHEILRSFSFPEDQIDVILHSGFSDSVMSGLSSGLPFVTANVFASHIFDLGAFPCSRQPFSTAEDIVHCAPAFCLHYSPKAPPSLSEWSSAYNDDPETKLLLEMLSVEPKQTAWTKLQLQKVHPQFREPLRNGTIAIFQHRLVMFQHLDADGRQLMLIVVPVGLRRDVFAAYHAAPSAGHLRFYKTLHRLRTRFFGLACALTYPSGADPVLIVSRQTAAFVGAVSLSSPGQ
jgi:hypothetical protein